MSNVQRYVLLALAAVVLVVGFVVLSPGGGDDDSSGATNAATQAAPAETEASGGATAPAGEPADAGEAEEEAEPEPAAEPAEPAEPRVPTIRVRGGEPVGGVQELSFEEGDEIDFRVRSDQADEVHVHGYDIEKPVAAGGSVRFRFEASIVGRFEVELHGSHTQIARLEVQP